MGKLICSREKWPFIEVTTKRRWPFGQFDCMLSLLMLISVSNIKKIEVFDLSTFQYLKFSSDYLKKLFAKLILHECIKIENTKIIMIRACKNTEMVGELLHMSEQISAYFVM